MPFKLSLQCLRLIATVFAIALFMVNDASGQSAQQSEDSRAKEMRQMWQNVVNRRSRRQVKVARPATPGSMTRANDHGPKPDYRIVSPTIPTQGLDIGITVWRLRPSQQTDAFAAKQGIKIKRLKHNPGSTIVYLTAERVGADTPLREGEMVQLSVEVPQDGFLYVIGREQYADGKKVTYGAPYLIFPTLRTNEGFNRVGPGILSNIPAVTDDPPFFNVERSSQNHVGEEITFIVSPRPLMELSGKADQTELAEEQLRNLQGFATQTGRIELVDGAGKAQTSEEAEAARSSTSDGTKRLKHDSPLPQTIFRVARKLGKPFVLTILLKIAP